MVEERTGRRLNRTLSPKKSSSSEKEALSSSNENDKAVSDTHVKRMEYLNSRVAQLFTSGASSSELGSIALELLAFRNDLESRQREGSDEALRQLRELEKMVISLYMLNILGEQKTKVTDYLFRQYIIYER